VGGLYRVVFIIQSTHILSLQAHREQCPFRERLANVHAQ